MTRVGNEDSPREREAIDRFIEEMGLFYEASGLPRIAGRIVSLLITSTEPLSAEQIARRLSVSRSSVSTNLRLLLTRGAAEPVSFPGDRLTYYRFSSATWQRTLRTLLESFMRLSSIVQLAIDSLGSDHPSRLRLQEYRSWISFFERRYEAILADWPGQTHEKEDRHV